MIHSRLILVISQNCSCQLSKLQLPATVIKIKEAMQELVHDTSETDQYDIPKLQLPAIKTVAASYSDKKYKTLRRNQFMILSSLIAMISQNYSCQLSKLQLPATVIKIQNCTQELVHDTFEPNRNDIPKLQLPAIKTVAASYRDKNSKEYVGIGT